MRLTRKKLRKLISEAIAKVPPISDEDMLEPFGKKRSSIEELLEDDPESAYSLAQSLNPSMEGQPESHKELTTLRDEFENTFAGRGWNILTKYRVRVVKDRNRPDGGFPIFHTVPSFEDISESKGSLSFTYQTSADDILQPYISEFIELYEKIMAPEGPINPHSGMATIRLYDQHFYGHDVPEICRFSELGHTIFEVVEARIKDDFATAGQGPLRAGIVTMIIPFHNPHTSFPGIPYRDAYELFDTRFIDAYRDC